MISKSYAEIIDALAYSLNKVHRLDYSRLTWEFLLYRDVSNLIHEMNTDKNRQVNLLVNLSKHLLNLGKIVLLRLKGKDKIALINSNSLKKHLNDYHFTKLFPIYFKSEPNIIKREKLENSLKECIDKESSEIIANWLNTDYLECFNRYLKWTRGLPLIPENSALLSSSYPSIYLRIYIVNNAYRNKGFSIETIQHGAHYFESINARWLPVELRFSNTFYSWFDTRSSNVFSLIPYRIFDSLPLINSQKEISGKILLILNTVSKSNDFEYYQSIAHYFNSNFSDTEIHVRLRTNKGADLNFQNNIFRLFNNACLEKSKDNKIAIGSSEVIYIDLPFSTSYWEAKLANKKVHFFTNDQLESTYTDWYKSKVRMDSININEI